MFTLPVARRLPDRPEGCGISVGMAPADDHAGAVVLKNPEHGFAVVNRDRTIGLLRIFNSDFVAGSSCRQLYRLESPGEASAMLTS
jgi:hypothetical protein